VDPGGCGLSAIPEFVSASAQKEFPNLATIMPNGTPQVTAVWFDLDGRYIRVVGTH